MDRSFDAEPSMDAAPRALLHVLIVNYNSAADLRACLRSLIPERPNQIVIVDNDSAVEDYERVVRLAARLPGVTLHRSSRNLGFAGGINQAFALANPAPNDLIWLVNPDATASPGVGAALAAALASGDADIVSPVILTGEGERPGQPTVWYGGGGVRVKAGESFHIATQPTVPAGSGGVVPTGFVTGAALMTCARTWRALHGLREDLFLYWEDTDLSLRALEGGYRLAVVADAQMWHRVGGSSARSGKSEIYYYSMARNRLVVCGERTPRLGVLFGRGLRASIRLTARAAREPQHRWRKVAAVLRGSAHGLGARRPPSRAPAAGGNS